MLKVVQVVAVAVTKQFIIGLALTLMSIGAAAAVLPEDRSDIMYHGYEGGGLEGITQGRPCRFVGANGEFGLWCLG